MKRSKAWQSVGGRPWCHPREEEMSDTDCDTVHCPECHEAPLLRARLAAAEALALANGEARERAEAEVAKLRVDMEEMVEAAVRSTELDARLERWLERMPVLEARSAAIPEGTPVSTTKNCDCEGSGCDEESGFHCEAHCDLRVCSHGLPLAPPPTVTGGDFVPGVNRGPPTATPMTPAAEPGKPPNPFFPLRRDCEACGEGVVFDEDGLCMQCGRDTVLARTPAAGPAPKGANDD